MNVNRFFNLIFLHTQNPFILYFSFWSTDADIDAFTKQLAYNRRQRTLYRYICMSFKHMYTCSRPIRLFKYTFVKSKIDVMIQSDRSNNLYYCIEIACEATWSLVYGAPSPVAHVLAIRKSHSKLTSIANITHINAKRMVDQILGISVRCCARLVASPSTFISMLLHHGFMLHSKSILLRDRKRERERKR